MTGGVFPRLGIVDVVIVGKFFTWLDVAHGDDQDATLDLVGFTVGTARMVDECGHAKAVNDRLAPVHAEQVRDFAIGVHPIRLPRRQAWAGVLQDVRALRN